MDVVDVVRAHHLQPELARELEESRDDLALLGDAVVLTGIAQIKVVSNGTPNAFGVRFTDVYARRNGKWQMVTWQSTRLPA